MPATVFMNPILTPARLPDYQALMADPVYGPWIEGMANDLGVNGRYAVYGDSGMSAAIRYWMSGDPKYANVAHQHINEAKRDTLAGYDPNYVRKYFIDNTLMGFYCWHGFTQQQQANVLALLKDWLHWCYGIGTPNYVGGSRTNDSDQTIGEYGGITYCQQLFPEICTDLPLATGGGGETPHIVGGLDPKGLDFDIIRDALAQILAFAEGGQYPVSSMYNVGDDTQMYMKIALGLKHITGRDHFPEVTAWWHSNAIATIHDICPNQKDVVHWGDEQYAFLRLWDWIVQVAMLARGLEEDGDVAAEWMNFLFNELIVQRSELNRINPDVVLWLKLNAKAQDYRPVMPAVNHSPGVGYATLRLGWTPKSLLAMTMCPNMTGLDHVTNHTGTVQAFILEEWPFLNGISYGPSKSAGPIASARYCNRSTMAMYGELAFKADPTGKWMLHVGHTWDKPTVGYAPPDEWLHEGVRSIVVIPEINATIICDRINCDDPRVLNADAKATVIKYHPDYYADIMAARDLKEVLYPVANSPTVVGGATWSTNGGMQCRLDAIASGGDLATYVDDLKTLYGDPNTWNPINPLKRVCFGTSRVGFDAIVSMGQYVSPVVPVPIKLPGIIGFKVGDTNIIFSSDPATRELPVVIPAEIVGTIYAIGGTDVKVIPAAGAVAVPPSTGGPTIIDVPVGSTIRVGTRLVKVTEETHLVFIGVPGG